MGCSSTKEKTTNPSLVFNPQSLRPITYSISKYHQVGNPNRIPKKTIWEARVIIENQQNKQSISNLIALMQTSYRLKQISHFRLSLDNGIDTKLIGVQSLRQSFRNIKSLNKLSLNCPAFCDSAAFLRTVSNGLKKNTKSLKIFNLKLHPSVEVTANEMDALCSLLNQLCYISNLTLNLTLSLAMLEELVSTLENLRSLTTLNLILVSWKNLDAEGIENFLVSLRLLPSFCNLSLNFYFCESLDDRALQFLSSGLKNLSVLSTLKFKLSSNKKVSNQGIKDFLLSLGSLTRLSGLDLCLSDCKKVNNRVMKSLCSMLKQLTLLSSLNLKLNWKLDNETITQLFHCLLDFPFLSNLALNLWITDKGIKVLSLVIEQLKSLSSLHLDFPLCFGIRDELIFSKHLLKLSRLSSLSIFFVICSWNDENIFKALSYLTLLTSLSLKLWGCKSTQPTVTESLYATLKYLNLLSDLELEFDFMMEFDQHKLDEFTSQLKRVNPSLRLIKILSWKKVNGLYLKIDNCFYF